VSERESWHSHRQALALVTWEARQEDMTRRAGGIPCLWRGWRLGRWVQTGTEGNWNSGKGLVPWAE
jgi:hypothetical protein